MMRLGSEFGIFLIFTAAASVAVEAIERDLLPVGRKLKLEIGIKRISKKQAAAQKREGNPYLVSVHGPDRPGIVYRVTEILAKRKFNITDLSTLRTTSGKKAGYILFIEGELATANALRAIQNDLARAQKTLQTKVGIKAISSANL